jgi:energy-converting hydrogenase Eha subunit G
MLSYLLTLNMYNKNAKKDWLTASVTAGIGAGIPAYVAVAQGQNPLLALGITGLAVVTALIIDHYW